MEEFQMNLFKHLSTITPQQLSQLSPQQLNQLRELTQLSSFQQLAQKQQQNLKNQQNQQQSQSNQNKPNANLQQQSLQAQQQAELILRLQQQQQQAANAQQQNQATQLTQQQLVYQQLSQNINFASSFPPTLVPPQNQANLYAYGYVQQPLSANANGQVSTEVKYKQLLAVIEEMSKDIRPMYSGSKTGTERFKRLIMQARVLIKECLNDINISSNSR